MTHYDRLEKRAVKQRDLALFRDLRAALAIAKGRSASIRRQCRTMPPEEIQSRTELAKVGLLRKSDLKQMQEDSPPFGGLATTNVGLLKRLLMSPGSIFEPEGHARDYWGAARALHAAGIRRGDIVLNCFSYHLTPGGHIMESGAHALGCPIIPAGPGNTEQQLEAIHHLRPKAYCGTPDFLKILLDKGAEMGRDTSCLQRALVSGAALPASLRAELGLRGIDVAQAYASAELGIIAYESHAREGLIVNEGLIVEIVTPGTGTPVAEGEIGEVVVTRMTADYPLLRFATGDLSAVLPGPSPCGRTNIRLRGWLGRADQTTKIKGMFVHPGQIAELGKRHPELGRLRLVVSRANEQDVMTLHAEAANADTEALAKSLADITKLRGLIVLAALGSLPMDGKIIADERPVG